VTPVIYLYTFSGNVTLEEIITHGLITAAEDQHKHAVSAHYDLVLAFMEPIWHTVFCTEDCREFFYGIKAYSQTHTYFPGLKVSILTNQFFHSLLIFHHY
jgi:hypothetical protein